MSDDRFASPVRALELLQQLGLELAFAAPGGTTAAIEKGLDDVEAACDGTVPNPIRMAIAACRGRLIEATSAGGMNAQTVEFLNQWQPWMVEAVMAWQRRGPLPAAPATWSAEASGAAAPAGPTPIVAPPIVEEPEEDIAVLPDDVDQELAQMFCAEAHELLQEVEQSVLVLEASPKDEARLDTLFRAFHTLKGNASVIKLFVLNRFTHELESLLDLVRRGTLDCSRATIDLILEGADVIRRFVTEMENQAAGVNKGRRIQLPIQRVIGRVRALMAGDISPAAASAKPAVPPPAPVAAAAPLPVPTPAPIATPTPAPAPTPAPTPAPVVADQLPAAAAATASASTVRVDTQKLDWLIDLVGELVVAQSMVTQSPELRGIGHTQLSRSLGQLRGITGDLQRTALALRMVPIGGAFRRMTRLVRDLAVQLGKEIHLKLEGEETELDRNIVEELSDPLVHMIRNSADHGLESPAERVAAGKPAAGTITLRAFHQDGFIVIQIADDGKGLNADRIRAKAVERGLVEPGDVLDQGAIYDLIFMPGFSTAEQVTGLSGRGVGMDVVRRNIERIRGKVEVDSGAGRGTTFTMYVPLTLAIIEGLIVGVGDQRYIIPTLSVRESFRPLPGMISVVQGRGELVSVRGRLTPLLRLGQHLNTPTRAQDPTEGIVVVVEAGQDCRCLFVDDLLGKQEVVIKSLGEMFRSQKAFAGAAILGDGRVGLILDVNALVKLKPAGASAA